jgi:cell division transport system ATP-binding protein
MAVVELEHVGKRSATGRQIISDISLTLEEGAFYFLTGASGAGKTTLLQLISLAERPSSGRLRLLGADTAALDRNARAALRRRIGIVFQNAWLLDELSAADNVALPLRIAGAPEHEIGDNVAELLAWVGLAGRENACAGTLSGGERQRVAVARAVVGRPALLVADEPMGKGGDKIALLLVRAFERISRLGTSVLIATDDIAFTRQFEHQRFHMNEGRLLDAGAASAQ